MEDDTQTYLKDVKTYVVAEQQSNQFLRILFLKS